MKISNWTTNVANQMTTTWIDQDLRGLSRKYISRKLRVFGVKFRTEIFVCVKKLTFRNSGLLGAGRYIQSHPAEWHHCPIPPNNKSRQIPRNPEHKIGINFNILIYWDDLHTYYIILRIVFAFLACLLFDIFIYEVKLV